VLCAHWLGKTSPIGVVFARKPGLPTANASPSIRGEGWVAVDARGSASSAETSPNSIEQGKAFQDAQSIAFDEDARPNLPYGAAALMNLDRPPFQGRRNGRAQTRNAASEHDGFRHAGFEPGCNCFEKDGRNDRCFVSQREDMQSFN
jgi:hypothetical protein